MLLQIFIVILWLNPDRFFQTLTTVASNDPSTQSVIGNFFQQWMNECETFVGIHDRRVCALGLCTLLRIDSKYYSAISNIVLKILPNCIHIYQGLMKTYQHAHQNNSDDDDDDDDSIPSEIEDGDDETLFSNKQTKTKQADQEMSADANDNDEDESDFDIDETDLESYSTVLEASEDIDEFQIFCESLQSKRTNFQCHTFSFSLFRITIRYNWI